MDKKLVLITVLICVFFIGTVLFSGCGNTQYDPDASDKRVCENGKCVTTNGMGLDECDTDADCT